MKAAAIGIIAALVVVACNGSDPSGSPSPTSPPASPPVETPTQIPSSGDFCAHRAVVGYAYRLVREGTVPYRQAAAAVVAASKVMRADVGSVPAGVGARKLRQFVFVLNTLRLAILGAAENYPEDYAVKQYMNALVDRVQDLSDALDCPPA
jgi:hypothetical protein